MYRIYFAPINQKKDQRPVQPSRFVRTANLLSFGTPWVTTASNDEALAFAGTVLGNVTVLRLMSLDKAGDQKGDFTQWTVIRDHSNPQLFLRTADGIGIWSISFKDFIKAKPCYVKFEDENKGVPLNP